MAVPMANDPPFATLNHFAADLGIPSESDLLRIGIRRRQAYDKLTTATRQSEKTNTRAVHQATSPGTTCTFDKYGPAAATVDWTR
jgi:hypothetical protein